MNGEQEKESNIGLRSRWKNLSLVITVCHHSASLMMPNGDPWNRFSYLTLTLIIGLDKQKKFSVKLSIFSYPSVLTYILGAQKNRLLSTHNIFFEYPQHMFWLRNTKIKFRYSH